MAEALQTYVVTVLAGERVAGILHGGVGTAVSLTPAEVRTNLDAKADAAVARYETPTAALAAIPADRYRVAMVAGRLGLFTNHAGTLRGLPFIIATDLDA